MNNHFSFSPQASISHLKHLLLLLLLGLTVHKVKAQGAYPPMIVIHLHADTSAIFTFGCSSYNTYNNVWWYYNDIWNLCGYDQDCSDSIESWIDCSTRMVPFDPDTLDVNTLEVDSLYAICHKYMLDHPFSDFQEGDLQPCELRGSQSYMLPLGMQYFMDLWDCATFNDGYSMYDEIPYLADTTLAQVPVRFGIMNRAQLDEDFFMTNQMNNDTSYLELGGGFGSNPYLPPTYQFGYPSLQQWWDTICFVHDHVYTYSIYYDDSDGDGWVDSLDCDPANDAINESYTEELCDGLDNNCDGEWESLPQINLIFTPDSLVSIPSTMVIENASTNCLTYEWNVDGVTSTDPYPTFVMAINDNVIHSFSVSVTGDYGCTDSYGFSYYLDSLGNYLGYGLSTVFTIQVIPPVSGIAETEEDTVAASSWPNPFSHITTISSPYDRNRYRVYSMDGRVVKQGYDPRSSFELDLSREPEGMYLLLLEDNMGNSCTMHLMKD